MKEMNLSQLLDISHPGTLFELLGHYRVVVPAIQRHYVQGANTPKANEVRGRFLNDLFTHFRENPNKPFKLDYVFGPIRTDGDDSFVPVDGQQRLTTLWLLARYAAEKLSADDQRLGILRLLERFSYEGRIYARRFCDALTRNDSSRWWKDAKQSVEKPSLALRRNGLLNPGWMADATVAAMSRMLDAIHGFWDDDIDAEQFLVFLWNQVRFELCHDQFADDIYMKMNARGLELTQWENFKGVFASNINDDSRKQFNEEIEKLSNLFYDKFKQESDEWKKLPDQAFFALIARLADYVLRTSPDQSFNEDLHKNLSILANSKVDANQIYVPIDELCLGDIANQLVQPFLRMVQWALDNSATSFKYWDGASKGIAKTLFFPDNDDERDFSLFLYEYFKKYTDGKGLWAYGFRALRLVVNVFENVSRDNFNRIDQLKQFIENNANLYCVQDYFSTKIPMQINEEFAKGVLYCSMTPEQIAMLQECESYMHGRVRIALFKGDENNCDWMSVADIEQQRTLLAVLEKRMFTWHSSGESDRIQLMKKVISCEPWEIKDQIHMSLDSDALRMFLSTRDDVFLQESYLAEEMSDKRSWAKDCPWRRDWRTNVFDVEDWNGRTVKWHGGTGTYFLYAKGKSNIQNAMPVADWRFDLWSNIDSAFAEVGKVDSVSSNYGGTRSFRCEWREVGDNLINIYLWKERVEIRWFNYDGDKQKSKWIEIKCEKVDGVTLACEIKKLIQQMKDERQ